METLPVPAPSNGSDDLATQPLDITPFPQWQQLYLRAKAFNLLDKDAQRTANVTDATIADWTLPGHRRYDPAFARALEAVRLGAALKGGIVGKEQAKSYTAIVVADAFRESRGESVVPGEPSIAPRDRATNRRMVLEGAGLLGSGSENEAKPPNQLLIAINKLYYSATPPPPGVAPPIDVVPEPDTPPDTQRGK